MTFLSIVFTLLSSLSIILVWLIFDTLDVPLVKKNLLAIIFSVTPAINIYGGVSLDGVIMTSATLFLFGILSVLTSKRISLLGLIAFLTGLTVTNLLSYGGVFLFAVAGIQAIREYLITKKLNIAICLAISTGVFSVIVAVIFSIYGYSHLNGFMTATALENPGGFQGLHMPVQYLATRVENISEIALFLSIGFLAFLFHPVHLGFSWWDWQDTSIGTLHCGLFTLFAMFACGAFRTGETARAALFIYPYFMLALNRSNITILEDILILTAIQTCGMQLLGGYFW